MRRVSQGSQGLQHALVQREGKAVDGGFTETGHAVHASCLTIACGQPRVLGSDNASDPGPVRHIPDDTSTHAAHPDLVPAVADADRHAAAAMARA